MTAPLYTLDVLRLAASTADYPRLASPDASAERRATPCGSRIVVDLTLNDDRRVVAFGHDVKACALGQAAAAIFARHAVGRSVAELVAARDALSHWLADEDVDAIPPDWPGIEVLGRARRYPARHGAVRLPFEAAADAAAHAAALITP